MDWALWLKAFHIVALAAWMAGMWYLPRLLVYHSDAAVGSPVSEQLKVMERRLLKAIATPAMVATLVLGVLLATAQGQWGDGWLHVKLVPGPADARLPRDPGQARAPVRGRRGDRGRRAGTVSSTRFRRSCSWASSSSSS
jgi:hypothetical protein